MPEKGGGGRVILLSGPRGSGKTSLLRALVDRLKPGGSDIAGILSLPVEEDGVKVAIDGLDLRSGELRRLAVRRGGSAGQLSTHQWNFDPEAMDWADRRLKTSPPCNLLIVDEIGILEFERGQGWQAGMKAVDGGMFRVAIVVVRPELLPAADARWPGCTRVVVDPADREQASQELHEVVSQWLGKTKAQATTQPGSGNPRKRKADQDG